MTIDYAKARAAMVEQQVRPWDVLDARVLETISRVPREACEMALLRALYVGEEREALFAVTIPEERGSFRRFCEVVGGLPGGPRNVTEFNYRISDAAKAHVFVGITTNGKGESEKIAKNFGRHGFEALDLTHDELAKEHLRHLVGGHSALAQDERLMRFTFPERPGALLKFLSLMQPTWNISLFHYRNQGADYGRILVGMQVPAKDHKAFDRFLDALGYPYVEETQNPVYRLFLQT